MKEQLEQIKQNALAALEAAETPAALEELRVKVLGKKGELTAVLKMMGKLSAEERPIMGQMANAVRAEIETKLEEAKASIGAKVLEAKLAAEAIDVTIPGEEVALGHQHPMNMVLQQVKDICSMDEYRQAINEGKCGFKTREYEDTKNGAGTCYSGNFVDI